MIRSLPYGMSRGDVVTRAFTDVDRTPHDGHAAAVSSAVATCTTRVPSASRLDTLDPYSWQPKQQCRTVRHSPWSLPSA